MKKLFAGMCSFVLLLVLFSSVQSQVTVSTSHLPLDQLSLADLDFQTGTSQNWFFTVNASGHPIVILDFSADVQLADANFPNAISFQTEPFNLPLTFTNLNIGPNSTIRIKQGTSVEFNPEAKTRLRNEALATGKLPAGTYTFRLNFKETPTGPVLGNGTIVVTVRNVSRLDLISPMDNESVPNPFPLFQWIFDGTNAELSVFERLPHHQSKEEATQGTPHLVQTLQGVSSLQYPSSAPRPLEPGKTYVWKVSGLTTGSAGVGSSINSELWQFIVSTGGGPQMSSAGATSGASQQNLIALLQTIPGISPQLLNQLASGNLQLTGLTLLNGASLTSAQLIAILNDLSQNPDKIVEVGN